MAAEGGIPIATRRSLITRLRDWRDEASWKRFFDTYAGLIYGVARQAGLRDAEAQDVVQETVVAVARRMPDFRYDPALGSFKNWLLVIARRRIVDQLRKQGRDPARPGAGSATGVRTRALERVPDPGGADLERLWDEEWGARLMEAALREVRGEVDAKQYQLFDAYVLKEWPVEEVTRTFRVTPNQVYLAKHRVGERLKTILRRLEEGGA